MEPGHTEQIRTFQWNGQAVATGGEDAKICSWRIPERGISSNSNSGHTGLMAAGASGGHNDNDEDDHDDDDAMDDGR